MFTTKKIVRFGDCDPGKIMFFANIYKFAHEAFEDFILSNFDYKKYYYDNKIGFPLVKSEASYRKPSIAGETLQIELEILHISDHAFSVSYNFYNNSELRANVKTVHVAVDINSVTKTKIPQEIKQFLQLHLKQNN